jgi:type II secretory pathway component PulJ
LLEVLLGLFLTALLLSVFVPFSGQLLRSWNREQRMAGETERLTTGAARLAADFATALPVIDRGEPAGIFFHGAPEALRFVRLGGEGGLPPQLEEVSLEMAGDALGAGIVRRRRLLSAGARLSDSGALGDPVQVLSRLGNARFQYIGPDGKASPGWKPGPALPRRVEVLIEARGATPPRRLVFPVVSDLPVSCLAGAASVPTPGGCPAASSGAPGASAPRPGGRG